MRLFQVAISLQSAVHVSKVLQLAGRFKKGHRTLEKLARRTRASHFESRHVLTEKTTSPIHVYKRTTTVAFC